MNKLILSENKLTEYVPDWSAVALVDSLPGSELQYRGVLALVVASDRVVCLTPEGQSLLTIYFESIQRVREIEFKGLIIERNGVLVAPNETFGVEIIYNGGGSFERNVRLLTRSANNAREQVETISQSVTRYIDDQYRRSIVARRSRD